MIVPPSKGSEKSINDARKLPAARPDHPAQSACVYAQRSNPCINSPSKRSSTNASAVTAVYCTIGGQEENGSRRSNYAVRHERCAAQVSPPSATMQSKVMVEEGHFWGPFFLGSGSRSLARVNSQLFICGLKIFRAVLMFNSMNLQRDNKLRCAKKKKPKVFLSGEVHINSCSTTASAEKAGGEKRGTS